MVADSCKLFCLLSNNYYNSATVASGGTTEIQLTSGMGNFIFVLIFKLIFSATACGFR